MSEENKDLIEGGEDAAEATPTATEDTSAAATEKAAEAGEEPPKEEEKDISNVEEGRRGSTTEQATQEKNPDLYLSDGESSADFVLVWTEGNKSKSAEAGHLEKREVFEQNLRNEGLVLEEGKTEGTIHVTKIHVPWEVLRRYAELLQFRMPMKEVQVLQPEAKVEKEFFKKVKRGFGKLSDAFKPPKHIFNQLDKQFTAIYSRDKEYLFDMHADIFTPSQRSRIAEFILRRKRFKTNTKDTNAFGVDKLVSSGTYTAAYPLHEGSVEVPGNIRYNLFTEWGSMKKFYKLQPLDHIKEYYGVQIGLYFAWLGFYTRMLLPASFVGLLCFIYGCITVYNNKPSEYICNAGNVTMCPVCDNFCGYWTLKETCLQARVSYLFDNPATVFFAVFMSIWAATFLEMWKRYSAEINHRWDLTGFDESEEHPRPEYMARLSRTSRRTINYVTKTVEPYTPFWTLKVPAVVFSFSVVLLLICMALAVVMGVVLYRVSTLAALAYHRNSVVDSYAKIITVASGAGINLCAILIFDQFYLRLARYLTNLELPRTQSEYDDSLILKIYLLQFINYYASIFYIAFFKGKFAGYPGKYRRLLGFRQEECGPGGCLVELCIQLSIIMIGKQALNTAMEIMMPIVKKWIQNLRFKHTLLRDESGSEKPQWAQDLQLLEFGSQGLFGEYLEMVLQFGFVAIFVSAFPLAPLFALANNIFEIRLDARKLLLDFRRPVAQRAKNIGVWFEILDSVGKFAVITNALIIAFVSNFIPHLVYEYTISADHSLTGFVETTLSYFAIKDFPEQYQPPFNASVEYCRYLDERKPPWDEEKYQYTKLYWHILAARFGFVVVFENIIVLVMAFVKWCIPDVPRELGEKIRREAYLTSELIMEQELLRAKREGQALSTEEPVERFQLDTGVREHYQDIAEMSRRDK